MKKDVLQLFIISILFTCAFAIFQCVNDDFITHIARTYNLSISFYNGNYNPYMYQSCYSKYGYPFGIFYPDTYLKPFAFLILIGCNIYFSMTLMLFCINLATLLIPYFLLQKTEWKMNAFSISLLYFLYPYRFLDYAIRFSIGELFFFVFFPFILYGLYKIFKEHKFSFGLMLGFWGVAHGHILSILLVIIFLIFFYLYNFKNLNKQIIKCTIINAILVLLSCIDVYLPILEAQINENLLYETNPTFGGTLLENTLQICKPNIMIHILVLLVIVFLIYKMIKINNDIWKSIISLIILFIFITNLFPWNWFSFLSIIQFPFRLFVYGCIPWVIITLKLENMLIKHSSFKIGIVRILCIIEILLTFAFAYVYESFDINKTYDNIGAGDYINSDVDSYDLTFLDKNKNRDLDIRTNNYLCENGFLPIFYNGRYEINLEDKILSYENKEGLLYIPELKDTNTNVVVNYKSTVIQNLSYIISIISTIAIFVYILKNNKRNI